VVGKYGETSGSLLFNGTSSVLYLIISCTVKIFKLHRSPDVGRNELKHVVNVMIRSQ
jgi:hypothetical protein